MIEWCRNEVLHSKPIHFTFWETAYLRNIMAIINNEPFFKTKWYLQHLGTSLFEIL